MSASAGSGLCDVKLLMGAAAFVGRAVDISLLRTRRFSLRSMAALSCGGAGAPSVLRLWDRNPLDQPEVPLHIRSSLRLGIRARSLGIKFKRWQPRSVDCRPANPHRRVTVRARPLAT